MLATHGRIDILVNNAGIARSQPALDETLEQIHDTIEINFIAAFARSVSSSR